MLQSSLFSLVSPALCSHSEPIHQRTLHSLQPLFSSFLHRSPSVLFSFSPFLCQSQFAKSSLFLGLSLRNQHLNITPLTGLFFFLAKHPEEVNGSNYWEGGRTSILILISNFSNFTFRPCGWSPPTPTIHKMSKVQSYTRLEIAVKAPTHNSV